MTHLDTIVDIECLKNVRCGRLHTLCFGSCTFRIDHMPDLEKERLLLRYNMQS